MKKKEPAIEQVAQWMESVLKMNNWTAQDWAKKAQTSPTNITRFLSKRAHLPNSATIFSLAEAAKSNPNVFSNDQYCVSIPIVTAKDKNMAEVRKLMPHGSYNVNVDVSAEAFTVTLDTDSMTLAGLLPGDRLICEPEQSLPRRHGHIIVYRDGKTISAGKYLPPYVMPHSSNAERQPIDVDSVDVMGIVVQSIRDLR
tara:strand:+ start:1781 stop:2374 length:594 start_codon:yes stop_codon:yes gene_type:complete